MVAWFGGRFCTVSSPIKAGVAGLGVCDIYRVLGVNLN